MRSPLDKVKSHNYTLFGFSSGANDFGKKGFFRVRTQEEQQNNLSKILGKRLRKLDVDDRYLEQFIKEMS